MPKAHGNAASQMYLPEGPTKNPDRHVDGSRVVSIRLRNDRYNELAEIIANSPLPHDTVGGYIAWLLETQVFRKR